MEDKKLVALVAVIVIVVLLGSFFFVLALVKESGDPFRLGKGVALVEMEGVVLSEKRMMSQLEDYRRAESVGAIVVRIDSRGAAVVAAHEIYVQIRTISEEGKPVVASLGNIAASGGYYVACGADKIVASPGTITGSIGAVMEFPNAEDLFKKIGLRFETIKSGKYKDIGSATRTMTEDERELLVQVVDDSWEQFISIVSEERELPMEEVLKVADGRIISGKRAMELGLIDELGTLNDAIMLAGELAGIEGRPKVIRKKRAFKILDLFGDLLTRISRTETPFSLEYKATIPY
jgi:protease-4